MNEEWTQTFSDKEVNTEDPIPFLECIKDFAQCTIEELTPHNDTIGAVLTSLRDSADGPDGLPYSAYACAPCVTIRLIILFIEALMYVPSFQLLDWVTCAYMVFLAKKKYKTGPNGLRIYEARNLRPLSLSNTFVKILATCFRAVQCAHVNCKLHRLQKCVSGRSMIDNVIELDAAMHEFALSGHPLAAAFMWGFHAAFPSVAHPYLWAVLELAGLPKPFH